ncbi:hypothetical protein FVO59_11220 [Microbacterium esteraromaticum]|uniref:Uncharacterized protein n=1 Tax=Microbacterium esteraromaticum TaxID=57043 RepID=A0A7D7WET9_9MICO|nr:hypothetical protein [Microbacterium esteraromaticum]QMU97717.1 hypothetical protein FVO59_11220 [Microbacterium esteraromaticum]
MPRISMPSAIRRVVSWMRRVDGTVQRIESENAELRSELAALSHEVNGLTNGLTALTDLTRATSREVDETRRVAMNTARRLTSTRGRIRMVFLVHNAAAWGSIAELVRLTHAHPDFEPVVVSIPHHYSGVGPAKGEGRTHRFLKSEGVTHIRLHKSHLSDAAQLLRALDPDIVVRQSQWDADIDEAFSAESLAWTRVILIPYETMNTTENVPIGDPPINSAVDTAMHRTAWLVFLANEEALAIARRDALTAGLQFRAVGHPKLDYVRETEPDWPLSRPDGTHRRRVLWSAHHSILTGWNDFGMFAQTHSDMLAWARDAPETEFVFMHHPLLPDTIAREGSPVSPAEYREWLNEWTELDNAAVWDGDYAEALAAADFLVTDGPSMMIEGQMLSVPTVFLERADHIPFNDIGREIARGVHRVESVQEARQTVLSIEESGADPLAARQEKNVARFFGEPGAAARILEVIRAEVDAERIVLSSVR